MIFFSTKGTAYMFRKVHLGYLVRFFPSLQQVIQLKTIFLQIIYASKSFKASYTHISFTL